MSEFNSSMAVADAAIEGHFGEPYRVERTATGQRADGVMLIVDHGVPVDLTDGPTLESTVEYRRTVVGDLSEGDVITRLIAQDDGYVLTADRYVLKHRIAFDNDLVTRVIRREANPLS
jgi:hypothetical protein